MVKCLERKKMCQVFENIHWMSDKWRTTWHASDFHLFSLSNILHESKCQLPVWHRKWKGMWRLCPKWKQLRQSQLLESCHAKWTNDNWISVTTPVILTLMHSKFTFSVTVLWATMSMSFHLIFSYIASGLSQHLCWDVRPYGQTLGQVGSCTYSNRTLLPFN